MRGDFAAFSAHFFIAFVLAPPDIVLALLVSPVFFLAEAQIVFVATAIFVFAVSPVVFVMVHLNRLLWPRPRGSLGPWVEVGSIR